MHSRNPSHGFPPRSMIMPTNSYHHPMGMYTPMVSMGGAFPVVPHTPPKAVMQPVGINPGMMSQSGPTFPYMSRPAVITMPPPAAQKCPTVYVGHLTTNVPDDVIKRLLMECGRVLKWTRSHDPTSQELSPFGFCEFDSMQGISRAIQFIHGVELDNQTIIVKCQEKDRDAVEQWQRERLNKAQAQNPLLTAQDIHRQLEDEEHLVEQSIRKMIIEAQNRTEREKVKRGVCLSPINDKTDSGRDRSLSEDVSTNMRNPTSASSPSTTVIGTEQSDTCRNKDGGTSSSFQSTKVVWMSQDYKVHLKERERMIRIAYKQRDKERELSKAERDLERLELSLDKDRRTYRERLDYRDEFDPDELRHLIKSDMRGSLPFSPHKKRHREDRRHVRKEERDGDMADRVAEAQEEDEAKSAALRVDSPEEGEIASIVADKPTKKDKMHMLPPSVPMPAPPNVPTTLRVGGLSLVDGYDEDTGLQNLAAAAAHHDGMSNVIMEGKTYDIVSQTPDVPIEKLPVHTKITIKSRDRVMGSLRDAFNNDEEEDPLFSRKHKPLTKLDEVSDPTNLGQAKVDSEQAAKERIERIASRVPTDKNGVLDFPIDFDLLIENDVPHSKLLPWVKNRVTEFLGAEEPSMIEYIMKKLNEKPDPRSLVSELSEMIDEEAEGFVLRMWRILIFEHLRLSDASS